MIQNQVCFHQGFKMNIEDYEVKILEDSVLTRKNPYDVRGSIIYLHGDVYRNLGSLTKNMTIELDPTPNSTFDTFMRDMNSLNDDTQEYELEESDKIKLVIIDEYLASLGSEIQYPKDRQKKVNMKNSIIYDGYISPFPEENN